MKKTLVCALLIMILAVTAFAAEWPEGLGPAKPYANAKPTDLTQNIGYIVFYPNAKTKSKDNFSCLRMYLPREDVVAGTGKLYLMEEKAGEVFRTSFDDAEHVEKRPITEEELQGLKWGSGVCFEVSLPFTLPLDKGYFVNVEENCVVTEDGNVGNLTIGGTEIWAFRTDAEYGVGSVEYTRTAEDGTVEGGIMDPKAGDHVKFELKLTGDAVAAILFVNGDSMRFEETEYDKSGVVEGEVVSDNISWGVVILNEAGDIIELNDFSR